MLLFEYDYIYTALVMCIGFMGVISHARYLCLIGKAYFGYLRAYKFEIM